MLLAVCLAGCGGNDTMPPEAEMAMPCAVDMVSTLCMDPRADSWALPLTKPTVNGAFKVTLAAGNPDPPAVGINTWTLNVTDANDQPVADAMVTVKPWMPDHGHGTSVKALITAGASPGSFTVMPLYLFMAGVWQMTFTIQSGTTSDQVVFTYCLADLNPA
jgi:hypothetical protein